MDRQKESQTTDGQTERKPDNRWRDRKKARQQMNRQKESQTTDEQTERKSDNRWTDRKKEVLVRQTDKQTNRQINRC